jgi:hypothetical protein
MFSVSGTHFCSRLGKPQVLVWPEELGILKKLIHLIGTQTRDLPACTTLLQQTISRENSLKK